MDINELHRQFDFDAQRLGDYHLLTKTELANGYCDAEEQKWEALAQNNIKEVERLERLRSSYHSALMLRYWYKIFEWAQNSSSLHLDYVDFVDWLYKGLWVAFYYRTWRWEYEAVCREGKFIEWKLDENGERIPNKYYWHLDPNAPDKMIQRCCGSIRGREYQYYNKFKRKASVQTYSIDEMVDDNGDSALDYAGCAYEESDDGEDGCRYIVRTLVSRGEGIEALIIDGIAYFDTFKQNKYIHCEDHWNDELKKEERIEYKRTVAEFDPRKLVKHLNDIDEQFMRDFCEMYSINSSTGDKIYESLKSLTNRKLYNLIEKTKLEIANDEHMVSCLTSC